MKTRLLNLSYFATGLGYWSALFFIPILILDITQSAMWVSISYALDVLPCILITPLAGVIGDKFRKKYIILIGEFVCFIAAVLLCFIPYSDNYIFHILFLGFIISSSSAVHHPIFQSILPELYKQDLLVKVNANIAMLTSLTGIIAPSILGILFGFLSNKEISLFIPLCYMLSFISFLNIKDGYVKNNKSIKLYSDLKESFIYLKNQNQLMRFSLLFFMINFGLKLIFTALIWIYTIRFDLEKEWIAIHFIYIGLMSILGAKFSAKYLTGKIEDKKIIYSSSLAIGIVIISILAFHSVYYLTFAWGMVSFLSMFIVVTYFTFRQKIVPSEQLSRVVALTRLISYLAIPPAALLTGWVLNHSQNESSLYIMAGTIILISTVYFLFKEKILSK